MSVFRSAQTGQSMDMIVTPSGGSSELAFELVKCPDGKLWGTIPDLLVPFPGRTQIASGPIVLPLGSRSVGYLHIVDKHRDKIKKLHPGLSLKEYLQDVLRLFQRIYLQQDGSMLLFRDNGMTKCAVIAPFVLNGITGYKVITAYPVARDPAFKRRGIIRLQYGR